jgi:hypothetical protein
MNQKNLLIAAAMFAALMATAALATTSLTAYADRDDKKDKDDKKDTVDTTTQEGIRDNDDADMYSSTPTKIKDKADCTISGFDNDCDIHSGAGIGLEDYLGTLDLDGEE